ncbi:hypothetical protein [Clostridium estertheticum]|uniref:hypothetical protein n=1 Tax=Clostridium estertheticum TaxID=238834 RepID=UPI00209B5658|nr:hypothetical protein [Clostridium estertheticum]
MKNDFNLSQYMNNGIENVVRGVVKASFRNPKETSFVLKYVLSSKEAKEIGVSFILLAGGEPLLRKDVIEKASELEFY